MTRDETIATLVLHGWQPFMTGSTILSIQIAAGIFNAEEHLSITFAPPAQLRWTRLDQQVDLVTCEWDLLSNNVIGVFGRVHDQREVNGVPVSELSATPRLSGRLISLEQHRI